MISVISVIRETFVGFIARTTLLVILVKQPIISKLFMFILVSVLMFGFVFAPIVEAKKKEFREEQLEITFMPILLAENEGKTKESQGKKTKRETS